MTEQELKEKFIPGKLFKIREDLGFTRLVWGSYYLMLKLEITPAKIELFLLTEKRIVSTGWSKTLSQKKYEISWLEEV